MNLLYRTLISEYKYPAGAVDIEIRRKCIVYAKTAGELVNAALLYEDCSPKPQIRYKMGDIQSISVEDEFFEKVSKANYVNLDIPKGQNPASVRDLNHPQKGIDWTDKDFPEPDEPLKAEPVKANIVYRVVFTEYERGFGQRPDGMAYAVDLQKLKNKIRSVERLGDSEEFSRAGEIGQCIVTDELLAEIAKYDGVLATMRNEHEGVLGICKPVR